MSESYAKPVGEASASPPASGFVHLHVHSEYSVLDGAVRIVPLLERCQELGMNAVAITDHGVLSSAVEFYKEATERGIKPIIGFEAYVAPDRFEKKTMDWSHLTLLAENNTGYQNLVRICSRGFLDGFYYKPRVDKQVLREHSEGIIALTGCLSGRMSKLLKAGEKEAAIAEVQELQDIFGEENVFIEIQNHGIVEQQAINPLVLEVAEETGRPLIATNDVHYLSQEDFSAHEALLCVQTGSTLDEKGMALPSNDFFLKSAEEMAANFSFAPEALSNTAGIADRCNVTMDFGKLLIPGFETPDGSEGNEYLRRLCEEGLAKRYSEGVSSEVRERLEFELSTISDMDFASYFLIVWDFVKFARDNDVAVGPGRGSAAGSLVAFCLGITDIDPLKYDLLFERFLNPGRKSMPDIDIDFSPVDREKVLAYVAERYGRQNVAQIITFGTMAARQATRDAGRVMNIPYGDVDRIVKFIPEGPKIKLADCLKPGQELRQAYDEEELTKKIIDLALPLEGLIRQDSIHAAGVVISDQPLTDYVPLQQKGEDAEVITQFTMKHVEALGLLKMDFLGLRNLDILKAAVRLIQDSKGEEIDLSKLPLDDEKTFEMLRQGQTDGVFQLESSGMKEAIREVSPTCFEDIIALVALYRPGCMEHIPKFARNKKYPGGIEYVDPRLEEILEPTYGVAVYQEQLIEIAKKVGGLTPAEADDLRKSIGKKNSGLLATLKNKFAEGCRKNQVDTKAIEELWKLMEAAAGYNFNKSHAAAYALVAYQTAWLKANYPVEYMAATISSVMSTKDKVPFYVSVCSRMGIKVLPPDVNESGSDFRVVGERIRFGLTAVKNVGGKVIDSIIATRELDGLFTSVFDFCRRVDSQMLKKNALESLIKCGALDSTGATRKGMITVMEQALGVGSQSQQDSLMGQGSIFDLVDDGATQDVHDPEIPDGEYSPRELTRLEKEILGIFVSGHPLIGLEDEIAAAGAITVAQLQEVRDKTKVKVIGMVGKVKRLTTKNGDPMAFFNLEDLEDSTEVVVFNKLYNKCNTLLEEDEVVVVKGRADLKGIDDDGRREVKIVANEISEFVRRPEGSSGGDTKRKSAGDSGREARSADDENGAGEGDQEAAGTVGKKVAGAIDDAGQKDEGIQVAKVVQLSMNHGEIDPGVLNDMKDLCQSYPGCSPVIISMMTGDGLRRLKLGQQVDPADEFIHRMQDLGGVRDVVVGPHAEIHAGSPA
ncbi:MAG: DNA polymerase III subunit alpha [Thermoleophilia bacterium]